MDTEWTEIRTAEDVTEAHVTQAADLREAEFGGSKLSWDEVVTKLEKYNDEDWGSEMTSPAIKHLQREVRKVLKDREQWS